LIGTIRTWFDVQTSAIALYVGQRAIAESIAKAAPEKRVMVQVDTEGKFHIELDRTRSFWLL